MDKSLLLSPKELTAEEKLVNKSITLSYLQPLYYKFKQTIDLFGGYRQINESMHNIKEIFDKEFDNGNIITHNYFAMPMHTALLSQYQILENLDELKELPLLSQIIAMYTTEAIKE